MCSRKLHLALKRYMLTIEFSLEENEESDILGIPSCRSHDDISHPNPKTKGLFLNNSPADTCVLFRLNNELFAQHFVLR